MVRTSSTRLYIQLPYIVYTYHSLVRQRPPFEAHSQTASTVINLARAAVVESVSRPESEYQRLRRLTGVDRLTTATRPNVRNPYRPLPFIGITP